MARKQCAIAGCPNLATSRGWCLKHYHRWRRHGDPLYQSHITNMGETCSVEGCERQAIARRYCTNHYRRWLEHGDATTNLKVKYDGVPCSVEGCQEQAKLHGLCVKHFRQWKYRNHTKMCEIEGCDKRAQFATSKYCPMHIARIRKYGDPHRGRLSETLAVAEAL